MVSTYANWLRRTKLEFKQHFVHIDLKYLFLGPFTQTPSRMQGVDFSSQLFSSKFGIVVPVKIIHEVWSFLHPFSLHVWIVLLLCIPTLILAMVLADYIYFASFATWQTSAGFVLRVACFDNTNHHPGRRKYGKVRGGIRVSDEPEKPRFRFRIPFYPPKTRVNPDFRVFMPDFPPKNRVKPVFRSIRNSVSSKCHYPPHP